MSPPPELIKERAGWYKLGPCDIILERYRCWRVWHEVGPGGRDKPSGGMSREEAFVTLKDAVEHVRKQIEPESVMRST